MELNGNEWGLMGHNGIEKELMGLNRDYWETARTNGKQSELNVASWDWKVMDLIGIHRNVLSGAKWD